jgi:hypothetical protein
MKKRTPFQPKEKFLSGTLFVSFLASSGSVSLPVQHLHSSATALEQVLSLPLTN